MYTGFIRSESKAMPTELHDMPGHLIRRAHQVSTALFAEECSGFDLTSVQYAALFAIAAHDGIDATRLATMIAFDRSTIGDVLERLESKGWITRASSSTDKRIKSVHLSMSGKQLLGDVAPTVARVQQRLLGCLSAGEQATAMAILRKLAGAADLPDQGEQR